MIRSTEICKRLRAFTHLFIKICIIVIWFVFRVVLINARFSSLFFFQVNSTDIMAWGLGNKATEE
jgi:hypothetical protein